MGHHLTAPPIRLESTSQQGAPPRSRHERRSRVVEVVGPAGAGKSTLCAELRRRGGVTSAGRGVWGLSLPWLVRGALPLVAACLPSARPAPRPAMPPAPVPRVSRPASSHAALRQLIRLRALHAYLLRGREEGRDAVETRAASGRAGSGRTASGHLGEADVVLPLTVLDEGPVFALSSLLVRHRDAVCGGRRYEEAWWRALRLWSATLDLVVVLDAPDEVLAARIRQRAKAHSHKQASDEELHDFLRSCRAALEFVLEALAASGGATTVIRLDAGRDPPSRLVKSFFEALGQRRSTC